jgi:hypothetical protein
MAFMGGFQGESSKKRAKGNFQGPFSAKIMGMRRPLAGT